MDINDLFENIANIFDQFADEILSEQAHKNKLISGQGLESEGKDLENFAVRENQIKVDFPIRSEYVDGVAVLKS
jgi:hypothetical protein